MNPNKRGLMQKAEVNVAVEAQKIFDFFHANHHEITLIDCESNIISFELETPIINENHEVTRKKVFYYLSYNQVSSDWKMLEFISDDPILHVCTSIYDVINTFRWMVTHG